jgi:hypothetical protein
MGMRPGRTTCVDVTCVNYYMSAGAPSPWVQSVFTVSPVGSKCRRVGGRRQLAPGEGDQDVAGVSAV